MKALYEEVQNRLFKPTLRTLSSKASSVNIKSTVADAAQIMVDDDVNGVLVVNDDADVVGIFTSKVCASLTLCNKIERM